MVNPVVSTTPGAVARQTDAQLRQSAERLEAAFLSEMLKHAGAGKARAGLGGGGIGEDQFASYLRDAQASAMVEAGGIGLAESLFHALKEMQND